MFCLRLCRISSTHKSLALSSTGEVLLPLLIYVFYRYFIALPSKKGPDSNTLNDKPMWSLKSCVAESRVWRVELNLLRKWGAKGLSPRKTEVARRKEFKSLSVCRSEQDHTWKEKRKWQRRTWTAALKRTRWIKSALVSSGRLVIQTEGGGISLCCSQGNGGSQEGLALVLLIYFSLLKLEHQIWRTCS